MGRYWGYIAFRVSQNLGYLFGMLSPRLSPILGNQMNMNMENFMELGFDKGLRGLEFPKNRGNLFWGSHNSYQDYTVFRGLHAPASTTPPPPPHWYPPHPPPCGLWSGFCSVV